MNGDLRGNALVLYKANLPAFDQTQKNIIVGTLLGDSSLYKLNNPHANCWLRFEQKIESKEYVDHLHSKFKDWCSTQPQNFVIKSEEKSEQVKFYWFRTYRHDSFKFYDEQFYKTDQQTGKQVKVVPKLIHRWLNNESLAYWFMGDGSKGKSGYFLHTEGFTLPENERLADALGKAFKLEVNIHRNPRPHKSLYKLYITNKSAKEFTRLVEPFILDCFRQKLIEKLIPSRK
jgi:hypothetical protein